MDNAEGARRTTIVLVDLGQSTRKLVKLVKNRVRERKLDQRIVGEQTLHLAPERRLDPKVVIHPQEAAGGEIAPQVRELGARELHVSMAAGEHEGVLEEARGAGLGHRLVIAGERDRGVLAHPPQQVDQGGAILVPVSAAAVLEAYDRELA